MRGPCRPGEEVLVDLGELRPLFGQVFFREDRRYRASIDAQRAIDAVRRVDEELGVVFIAVDAIHRADVDAGLVLNVDAGFGDYVGHGVSGGLRRDQASRDVSGGVCRCHRARMTEIRFGNCDRELLWQFAWVIDWERRLAKSSLEGNVVRVQGLEP
jgi:hypothetical protein